ncbi:MAG: phage holin family protein [Gallionella sp.]|nr:phage holin family protein [Gallionella sp.]
MRDSIGLAESLKRAAATLIVIVQTRLELLANEMQEERLHVERMMIYGSIALLFFALGLMLLTVFIVVLFWESHRLSVLGGLTGLFFVAGLTMWYALRHEASKRHKLFMSSLSELSDDHTRLSAES